MPLKRVRNENLDPPGSEIAPVVKMQKGVVLVFRPDVSDEKIEEFLRFARFSVLDHKYYGPFNLRDLVEEFDPRYGGPVWYVP